MRQKRDPDRGPARPARVAREKSERFRSRMPRGEPALKVLGREPRVREDRLENADVRLVEESRKERGRREPGHRDLLADGEKPERLFELAVRRGPHGRRRARLAADVQQVAPQEILEASQRRMPRREGVRREGLAAGLEIREDRPGSSPDTSAFRRGRREGADEGGRRFDGIPAGRAGRFHRGHDRAPHDDAVRK